MNANKLIILLLLSLAISELHMIIGYFYPETRTIEYNLFLDNEYKQKITVLWYMYELSHILDKLIWAYCLYEVAKLVSNKLMKVCIVFIVCYVVQFVFYIYNRNTSFFSNSIVYLYMILIFIYLLIPEKSKIIRIDDY